MKKLSRYPRIFSSIESQKATCVAINQMESGRLGKVIPGMCIGFQAPPEKYSSVVESIKRSLADYGLTVRRDVEKPLPWGEQYVVVVKKHDDAPAPIDADEAWAG